MEHTTSRESQLTMYTRGRGVRMTNSPSWMSSFEGTHWNLWYLKKIKPNFSYNNKCIIHNYSKHHQTTNEESAFVSVLRYKLLMYTWSIFVDISDHFPDLLLLWFKPQCPHCHLSNDTCFMKYQYFMKIITLCTLSSLASILPEPSASKRSNASRISCFCSSVSSFLGAKDRKL